MSRELVKPCPYCEGGCCSECDNTGQRVRTHIDAGDGVTMSVSGSAVLSDEARDALAALARAAFAQMAIRRDGMTEPSAANGYKGARYLRDTPYATVTEWRRATVAAIPEDERCGKCGGTGRDVILASNGGVGEVVTCWPCCGTGRTRR